MNTDDFEKRLSQQSLRPLPAEWRAEILQNVKSSLAAPAQPSTLNPQPLSWLRELLWPCPQAWAGLAAIWLVILGLNLGLSGSSQPLMAKNTTSAAPEFLMTLQEQHRLMAELLESHELRVAERPKVFRFGPRSECRREECAAV